MSVDCVLAVVISVGVKGQLPGGFSVVDGHSWFAISYATGLFLVSGLCLHLIIFCFSKCQNIANAVCSVLKTVGGDEEILGDLTQKFEDLVRSMLLQFM